MDATGSQQDWEQRALAALNVSGKTAAVRVAGTRLETVRELREKLAEAEREYGEAFAVLPKLGWDEADLLSEQIGLEEPTKRPPGRPAGKTKKRRRPPAPRSGQTPQARADEAPPAVAPIGETESSATALES